MKPAFIQPKENFFTFDETDRMMDFAEANKLEVVGHTLVWKNATPSWFFVDANGNKVSREVLIERLKKHIRTVVGRYKGRVKYWDVVNEALNDDGSLRESNWLKIIGEDYIEIAFEMAAKAAPNAKLYYNDYSLTEPKKRRGAVRLIRSLQAKGVKIDGIGFQGHYGLTWPRLNELEDSIKAFAKLGIDIFVSELDVSVLPRGSENQLGADISLNIEIEDKLNPYPRRLPPVIEAKLARRYHEIFAVLNKHRDSISRVSVWGLSDENSWLNDWPVKERTDYPLLFDRQMKKKSFVSSLHLAK